MEKWNGKKIWNLKFIYISMFSYTLTWTLLLWFLGEKLIVWRVQTTQCEWTLTWTHMIMRCKNGSLKGKKTCTIKKKCYNNILYFICTTKSVTTIHFLR
jgi:hypothetical protein